MINLVNPSQTGLRLLQMYEFFHVNFSGYNELPSRYQLLPSL